MLLNAYRFIRFKVGNHLNMIISSFLQYNVHYCALITSFMECNLGVGISGDSAVVWKSGIQFLANTGIFLFAIMLGLALGLTPSPTQ